MRNYLVLSLLSLTIGGTAAAQRIVDPKVILIIGDGMDDQQIAIARNYLKGMEGRLVLDGMQERVSAQVLDRTRGRSGGSQLRGRFRQRRDGHGDRRGRQRGPHRHVRGHRSGSAEHHGNGAGRRIADRDRDHLENYRRQSRIVRCSHQQPVLRSARRHGEDRRAVSAGQHGLLCRLQVERWQGLDRRADRRFRPQPDFRRWQWAIRRIH